MLGYALIFSGLHDGSVRSPNSFGTTCLFSAGAMLSFAVGGIEATGIATRDVTAIEAASGFGLFALVISLLFSLFSSFQRRETAVVALDALAGAPPSGVQLLEHCAADDMPEQLMATFDEWRLWTVDVLESHLSYPLLFYFRSSHDNEAWANSFGAVMDAATLVLSTVDGVPAGHARLMYKVGHSPRRRHALYFKYAERRRRARGGARGVGRRRRARLRKAGYRLRETERRVGAVQQPSHQVRVLVERDHQVPGRAPGAMDRDRSYLPHRERGPAGRRRTSSTPR